MKVWRFKECGGKFEDRLNWVVENERDVLFWSDIWVD